MTHRVRLAAIPSGDDELAGEAAQKLGAETVPAKAGAGRKDDGIQPAKNAGGGSRFLQIVAKPHRAPRKPKPESKLTRVAFRVSRLMEFCSTREQKLGAGMECVVMNIDIKALGDAD